MRQGQRWKRKVRRNKRKNKTFHREKHISNSQIQKDIISNSGGTQTYRINWMRD